MVRPQYFLESYQKFYQPLLNTLKLFKIQKITNKQITKPTLTSNFLCTRRRLRKLVKGILPSFHFKSGQVRRGNTSQTVQPRATENSNWEVLQEQGPDQGQFLPLQDED